MEPQSRNKEPYLLVFIPFYQARSFPKYQVVCKLRATSRKFSSYTVSRSLKYREKSRVDRIAISDDATYPRSAVRFPNLCTVNPHNFRFHCSLDTGR